MLRRTKSSSLLPIVRLTNYFYPEDKDSAQVTSMEVYSTQAAHSGRQGALTPPPDYEQLYQAMQLDTLNEEDRVRRKYACQGVSLVLPSRCPCYFSIVLCCTSGMTEMGLMIRIEI